MRGGTYLPDQRSGFSNGGISPSQKPPGCQFFHFGGDFTHGIRFETNGDVTYIVDGTLRCSQSDIRPGQHFEWPYLHLEWLGQVVDDVDRILDEYAVSEGNSPPSWEGLRTEPPATLGPTWRITPEEHNTVTGSYRGLDEPAAFLLDPGPVVFVPEP